VNTQQKREKICPYCAEAVEKLTKEHIVSRGLFVPPYPDNMPTVKACEPCNQIKGVNEDYLRDFLILDREARGSSVARALIDTTLTRSIVSEEHGNTSKIALALVTDGQRVALATRPGGIIWGQAIMVRVEIEKIKAVLAAMMKGFYFKRFRKILPPTHTIDAVRIEGAQVSASWDLFTLRGAKRRTLGQVFSCQSLSFEDEQITMWQFLFYQSILFELATYPPGFTPPSTRGRF
jgi:hypothetical protein